jgi:DNA topoisomerase-3
LEIRNFAPLAYFEVVAAANVAGGQFRCGTHLSSGLSGELAQEVVNAARGFEGPLDVRVEDKRQGPPSNTICLRCRILQSRFAGQRPRRSVAQELYDGQGNKIITYPRRGPLPAGGLIKDVPIAPDCGRENHSAQPVPEPLVFARVRAANDKGLEGASHHAVIPNVNMVDELREIWPRLSIDEKKLFDVIARAYLAAIMPDFRYRQTTATLDVRGFAFRAAGRQPIELGWRAAFPDWQPADEKGDDTQLLPALRNGEITQLENPTIEDKETRPPPRYNEGTLIEAMQNAWRFVDNEVLRERLREAKGIGTPATRAEIIGG